MDGSTAQSRNTGAPPVPFGIGPGESGIQLVLGPADAAAPFVTLHSGRFSVILMARQVAPSIDSSNSFALKLQRHDYAYDANTTLTNLDIEAMWEREAADLLRVSSPNVIRGLATSTGLAQHPPLAFCRLKNAYFPIPCPETGSPLTTCRDDDLLRTNGLAAFSRSLVRYLYSGSPDAKAFYRVPGPARESARPGVRVRIGGELWRDIGEALRRERLPAGTLPCQTCEHRAECFPGGLPSGTPIPAEQQIHPVSFYDYRMVPLELLDLTFDDYCDWLGGSDAVAVAAGKRKTAAPAWFFARDEQRRWAEILYLKVAAFREVCNGLLAIHEQCARPHLGVAPANVMVQVCEHGDAVPARWNCRIKVIDLGSCCGHDQRTGEGIAPPLQLLEPGGEIRGTTYQSPRLADKDGLSAHLQLRVAQKSPVDGRVMVSLTISIGPLDVRGLRPGDVVSVRPTSGLPEFWAELVSVGSGKAVAVANVDEHHVLAEMSDKQAFEASCVFRKVFGAPSDLYGLGMLLFRALLVNDGSDVYQVHGTVESCLRRIDAEVGSRNDPQRFERIVRACVRENEHLFAPGALCFTAAERGVVRPALDGALWPELLLFAFRLVTAIPGVSFADSHAETHSHQRGALMRFVLESVDAFLRRARAEMFGLDRLEQIAAACQAAKLAAESELIGWVQRDDMAAKKDTQGFAAPRGRGAGSGEDGFVLKVVYDGAPQMTRSFPQDQVTLGRARENLLVLAHEQVSGRHALIERSGSDYVLIDRGSTNGTLLNGQPVASSSPNVLRDGDVVTIGPYLIEFVFADGSATVVPMTSTQQTPLLEDLLACYARHLDAEPAERRNQLDACLATRRQAQSSPKEMLLALRRVEEQLVEAGFAVGAAASGASEGDPELSAKARVVLDDVVKQIGLSALHGAGDLDRLGEGLCNYLARTLEYIKVTCGVRREASERLEVDATGMLKRDAGPIHDGSSMAEVAAALLGGSGVSVEAAKQNLDRALKDFTAMQVGILKGCQDMVKFVLDNLSPEQLVRDAEARAGLMARQLNSAATRSSLWAGLREAHARFTSANRWESDIIAKVREGIRKAHLKLDEP